MDKLRVLIGVEGVLFELVNSKSKEVVECALITPDDALSLVSSILTSLESGGEASFPAKSYQNCTKSEGPVQLELDLFRKST